jgi:hypothetical protein
MKRFFRYRDLIITTEDPYDAVHKFMYIFDMYDIIIIYDEVKKSYDITHLKSNGSIDYIKNDDMCFSYKLLIIKTYKYLSDRPKFNETTCVNIYQ